jgi:ribosomal protein L9
MGAVQTANTATFESVWATLDRITQRQEEAAREMKEDRERLKETERIMKEHSESVNNQIGSLTNLFGDVTEAMVAPKICEKFDEFGFNFLRANSNVRVNDRVNNISFEVDIMLENGEKAMLVEVKTKLTIERVNKNIERLEKMRNYANLHGDRRIFLGAVAGIVVTDEVRDYALNQGLYLLEYAGENFNITPPNGQPKEW